MKQMILAFITILFTTQRIASKLAQQTAFCP
jgi:hypothetical protein